MGKSLFHSKVLLDLYKEGKLDKLFKKHPYLNSETWLGAGSEATSFYDRNTSEVIKICPKTIRYFRYTSQKKRDPSIFLKHSNEFHPYFLPVKEIIYEDDFVFVYRQDYCRPLKHITIDVVIQVLQLVEMMLKKKYLVTDIGRHNLGMISGRIVLFDYHGLHPVNHHRQWWKRLCKNLAHYFSGLSSTLKKTFLRDLSKIVKDDEIKTSHMLELVQEYIEGLMSR